MNKLFPATKALALFFALGLAFPIALFAQEDSVRIIPAPNRRADEGKGPFKTFVIRGAMLIDGTGAAPAGPMDIVVENNRIK